MNIKDLSNPLDTEFIEFRVQSIGKYKKDGKDIAYAIIVPYKDARADMIRLDEVVWPFNWKREHTRDNKNCIVSIWDEWKLEWISKEDTGTESNTEKEKGLASDSFKRACVNWGIGRELYEFPTIFVTLEENEFYLDKDWNAKATNAFKIKEWKWKTKYTDWKLEKLKAEYKTKTRFTFWV